MSRILNKEPENYTGPKNKLEAKIVCWVLRKMLGQNDILIFNKFFHKQENLKKRVVFFPPRLQQLFKILANPGLKFGETFQKGLWYTSNDDLFEVMKMFLQNTERPFFKYYDFLSKFKGLNYLLNQKIHVKYGTRKVKEHYNVSHIIYETILDEEMVYTCALFENTDINLKEAQIRKLNKIIERMSLPNKASVIEIGCGWGALARRIVRERTDVTYHGLSISQNQIEYCKTSDKKRLDDTQRHRIQYHCQDYLDFQASEKVDGVAVIGMMEHVGLSHYSKFFDKISSYLKPNGKAVVHTIIADYPGDSSSQWIQKYIFPGGRSPSVSEITTAVEKSSLKLKKIETYPPDNYEKTIIEWRKNLINNWPTCSKKLEKMGTPTVELEYIFRTWYFYLSAVQTMFNPKVLNYSVAHVVMDKD